MKSYYTERLRKEKDVLTISDVIRLTGFSKSGVLNWLSLKKLHAFRMGKAYMEENALWGRRSPIYKKLLTDYAFWMRVSIRMTAQMVADEVVRYQIIEV